ITTSLPQKHIFGHLLADGTGAPYFFPFLVVNIRPLKRFEVETPMVGKILVFRRYGRQMRFPGNFVVGAPLIMNFGIFSSKKRLHLPVYHGHGKRNGKEFKKDYSTYGQGKEIENESQE